MELLKDIFRYIKVRKRWWLTPLILVLLILGLLMFVTESTTLGAFLYPLF
jgi:hypothetical protein